MPKPSLPILMLFASITCPAHASDAVTVGTDGTAVFLKPVSAPNVVKFDGPVAVTAAGTLATTAIGRVHAVSGTSADYAITLPGAAASAGGAIAFSVGAWGSANRQYTVAAAGGETIDGRASLILIHTNYLEIVSTGTQWISRAKKVDTDWVDAGAIAISASTTAPGKPGTRVRDNVFWRRSGSDLQLRYEYIQSTAGTAGSGTYFLGIPFGSVDSSRIHTQTTVAQAPVIGVAAYNPAGSEYIGHARWTSAGISVVAVSGGSNNEFTWGSGGGSLSNASIRVSVAAAVPMLNW